MLLLRNTKFDSLLLQLSQLLVELPLHLEVLCKDGLQVPLALDLVVLQARLRRVQLVVERQALLVLLLLERIVLLLELGGEGAALLVGHDGGLADRGFVFAGVFGRARDRVLGPVVLGSALLVERVVDTGVLLLVGTGEPDAWWRYGSVALDVDVEAMAVELRLALDTLIL